MSPKRPTGLPRRAMDDCGDEESGQGERFGWELKAVESRRRSVTAWICGIAATLLEGNGTWASSIALQDLECVLTDRTTGRTAVEPLGSDLHIAQEELTRIRQELRSSTEAEILNRFVWRS